jgi:hypothetical protein
MIENLRGGAGAQATAAAVPALGSRIACPRCTAAMQPLQLPSHRPLPVTVDLCAGCRLVWFDELESVQLDGLGWTRLLREMESGVGRPLSHALVGQAACPSCKLPLKAVSNRTRFGLFSALECPARHGHLQGHTALLAERGLVRPMGAAERLALTREKHAHCCFNCGGPATAADDACSWCGTALVVVDMPRLAHSLRLRVDAQMGPSPSERGRLVTWPCRGCGTALDPTRQTRCPSCEHLVVAHELPDLLPLLDAAETELAAVAAAHARRRAGFRSAQAAEPGAVVAGRARANAPIITRHQRVPATRTQALLSVLPLMAIGLVAALLLAVVALDLRWPPKTPLERLHDRRVGHDPAGAWGWVVDHGRLAAQDRAAQRALREGLLDLHLRQLLGEHGDTTATVGSLSGARLAGVANGNARDPLERWGRVRSTALRALPADSVSSLPEPWASSVREPFASAAPGVWVARDSRSLALWLPTVENAGSMPLPLREVNLRMMDSAVKWVSWRCRPSAGNEVWLRSGERTTLSCETTMLQSQQESWLPLVRQLQVQEMPPLAWAAAGPSANQRAEMLAVTDRLVAAAALSESRPTAPPLPLAQRWRGLGPGQHAALVFGLLLAGFVAYSLLARAMGERRALQIGFVASLLPAVLLGRGEGAASVLLVGMYVAIALIALFGFAFVERFTARRRGG